MAIFKQVQAVLLSVAVAATPILIDTASAAGSAELQSQGSMPTTNSAAPSESELKELVAPIALYPDALVAQILAGSTYPTQVVEAERWVQQNSSLKGEQLASAINQQPWDDSIKALSQFPSVLNNMSTNLTWTSALGDAYFNDPKGVMNAVQILRVDAKNAGNLNSTPQQTVTTEGQTIVIQPANPEVVYVPTYSPEIYGTPVAAYPGYSGWGVAAASALSFGAGLAIGAGSGWGWGWGHWGANWHGGSVQFNRNNYVSRSNTFVNRNSSFNNVNRANTLNRANNVNRADVNRNAGNINRNSVNRSAGQFEGAGTRAKPSGSFNQGSVNRDMSRGYGGGDRSSVNRSSGSFGGVSQGGAARMNSSRGSSSFGGGGRSGGGFHGGGGGGRGGGGGGRGGGRR